MTLTAYTPANQFQLIVSNLVFIILLYFQPKLTLSVTISSSLLVYFIRFAFKKYWVTKTSKYRNRGSILITGCSSGIGATSLRQLLHDGYHVMGTFRSPKDVEAFKSIHLNEQVDDTSGSTTHSDKSLNKSSKFFASKHQKGSTSNTASTGKAKKAFVKEMEARFTPLILDVSNSESIQNAFPTIRKVHEKYPLIALINNAGLQVSGIVECLDVDHHVKQAFDVNVLGIYRMTKVCLPLLREAKKKLGRARIINISSVAGLIALPTATGYSATKWAVQAITQGLRNEVARFGIEVCTINPGTTKTKFRINAKTELERILGTATPEMKKELYPEYFNQWEKRYEADFKNGEGYANGKGIPVENVVNIVTESVETSHLQQSYIIAPEGLFVTILGLLPQAVTDFALRKTYKV